MSTQAKNIIDVDELRKISKAFADAPNAKEQIQETVAEYTAPIQEVYASVPEIKMFILGASFASLLFITAILIAKI